MCTGYLKTCFVPVIIRCNRIVFRFTRITGSHCRVKTRSRTDSDPVFRITRIWNIHIGYSSLPPTSPECILNNSFSYFFISVKSTNVA
ncbi:hypothetical protein DWX97_15265 [Bacteroides cellulosilyticus]|uniref:Uncharacterized protein n=1 Tax=Bacteroides cellulosilyticus TaxID=246787 RepID=A0A412IFF5_9BACE|nr:hypothetical protein DWX97_15265 [Bacteroides cellulosilyticus]